MKKHFYAEGELNGRKGMFQCYQVDHPAYCKSPTSPGPSIVKIADEKESTRVTAQYQAVLNKFKEALNTTLILNGRPNPIFKPHEPHFVVNSFKVKTPVVAKVSSDGNLLAWVRINFEFDKLAYTKRYAHGFAQSICDGIGTGISPLAIKYDIVKTSEEEQAQSGGILLVLSNLSDIRPEHFDLALENFNKYRLFFEGSGEQRLSCFVEDSSKKLINETQGMSPIDNLYDLAGEPSQKERATYDKAEKKAAKIGYTRASINSKCLPCHKDDDFTCAGIMDLGTCLQILKEYMVDANIAFATADRLIPLDRVREIAKQDIEKYTARKILLKNILIANLESYESNFVLSKAILLNNITGVLLKALATSNYPEGPVHPRLIEKTKLSDKKGWQFMAEIELFCLPKYVTKNAVHFDVRDGKIIFELPNEIAYTDYLTFAEKLVEKIMLLLAILPKPAPSSGSSPAASSSSAPPTEMSEQSDTMSHAAIITSTNIGFFDAAPATSPVETPVVATKPESESGPEPELLNSAQQRSEVGPK